MTVMEAIRNRRSVRQYSNKPIPPDVMGRMCEALRLAPSACNNQPWRFIIVTEAGLRQKVSVAAHNQSFVAEAPIVVVAVGFPELAYKFMGGYGNSIDVDLAIALDHLTLAAVEEGLGTCWIGAFTEAEVKAALDIPKEAKVVALTPLGYPANPGALKPAPEAGRKPANKVISMERF
jgi:nitroreductase